MRVVNPAALDINSGVESSPGQKDCVKIERMMQMIKASAAGWKAPQIFARRETT
jgi:hypothetical protein